MHTLVDGYNVTKADPATREGTLEDQRTALVGRLRARRASLLDSGDATVVFDGQQGMSAAPVSYTHLTLPTTPYV